MKEALIITNPIYKEVIVPSSINAENTKEDYQLDLAVQKEIV